MSEIINYCLKSPKQYLNRYMQSFMILGPAFATESPPFVRRRVGLGPPFNEKACRSLAGGGMNL